MAVLEPGEVLGGRLLIVRRLGGGRPSDVYEAEAMRDLPYASKGGRVAVKVYKSWVMEEPNQPARIRRELRAGLEVTSPNIVRTFEIGEDGALTFLVMEYLDGPTLDAWARDHPLASGDEVLRIAADIAAALAALHTQRLLHRDVKPTNIIVTPRGAVLLDLGIVDDRADRSLTESGFFLGTTAYAAPEYLFGGAYNDLADTYSFGAVLYALAVGFPQLDPARPRPAQIVAKRDLEYVSQFLDLFLRFGFRKAAMLDVLFEQCLSPLMSDRPTMRDLHQFFQARGWEAPFPSYLLNARSMSASAHQFQAVSDPRASLGGVASQDLAVCRARLLALPPRERSVFTTMVSGMGRHGGLLPFYRGTTSSPSKAAATVASLRLLGLVGPPSKDGATGRWAIQLTGAAWRLLLDGEFDPDLAVEARSVADGPWRRLVEGERIILRALLRDAAGNQGELSIEEKDGKGAFILDFVLRLAEDLNLVALQALPAIAALIPVTRRLRLTPLGWRFLLDGHARGSSERA